MNKGKEVVWLTGSANGVGKHLTNCFYRRGYNVVATDVEAEALKAAAEELDWDLNNVMLAPLDIADKHSWQNVFQQAIQRFGEVHILLNIAGYSQPGFLMETPMDELNKHIDINLVGTMLGSQLLAKHMVLQGYGHIINVASLAAIGPVPGLGFYSAAKFGLRGYSLALAHELVDKKVAVTVICPDLIKTRMFDLQLDYPKESALVFSGKTPLKVEDIEDSVFGTVLSKRPMEVLLPKTRGALVKFSGLFPSLAYKIGVKMRELGEKRIRTEAKKNKQRKQNNIV